jgi:ABC-2 type transport system ATP-binding protein
MLTGILAPSAGSVSVNGLDPLKQRYAHARQIGVVFGQRTQLWWDLAVIEAFRLLQKIYLIPESDYKARLERFVEVLDIGAQLHQPVRKLSLGQRMKCDLAASLLHSPPLLFLDEPTIGLDVAVKERVRRFIKEINEEGDVTIILTTHDLTDIEELCDRIIIIDGGKVLYDGSRPDLLTQYGQRRRIIIELTRDYLSEYAQVQAPPGELPLAFAYESLDVPGARPFMAALHDVASGEERGLARDAVRVRRLDPLHFQVSFDRRMFSGSDVIGRLLERFEVADLALHEPELGDIVRAIYEGRVPSPRPALPAPAVSTSQAQ